MKLKSIDIKAFRLFEDEHVEFVNDRFADAGCANFVAVYAPNGFGKTSMFDAIEFGMTNNIHRMNLDKLPERLKSERKVSSFSSPIHNKKLPNEKIRIRLSLEDFRTDEVVKDVEPGEEQTLLLGDAENDFFTKAILSQDWFSEFLSTTSAEERFRRFMEYFHESKDLLDYHSSLISTGKSLANELGRIVKAIEQKRKELQEDVDEHIIERIDALMGKMQTLSLKLGWNRKTDKVTLKTLRFECAETIAGIEGDKARCEQLLDNMKKAAAGWENIVALEKIGETREEKERLEKKHEELKTKLAKVLRLQNLMAQIEQQQKEKNAVAVEVERLRKLIEMFPTYQQRQKEIETNRKTIEACNSQRKQLNEQNGVVQKEKASLEETGSSLQKQMTVIENKIARIEEDYKNYEKCLKEISDDERLKNDLQQKAAQIFAEKENDEKNLTAIQKDLNIATSHKVTEEMEGFQDFTKKILEIELAISKRKEEIKGIEAAITQQTAYQDQVSNLLVHAREMMSDLKSGVCPLCGHDYHNVDELIKNITDNKAITTSIESAIARKEALLRANSQDNEQLEAVYKKLVEAIEQAVGAEEKIIEKIAAEHGNLLKQIDSIDKRIADNTLLRDGAYAMFKGLTKEQVAQSYQGEKDNIEKKIKETEEAQKDVQGRIAEIGNKIGANEAAFKSASEKIVEIESAEDYLTYKQLLNGENISDELVSLWTNLSNEKQETIRQYVLKIDQAVTERDCLVKEGVDFAQEAELKDAFVKTGTEKETLATQLYNTIKFVEKDCGIVGVTEEMAAAEILERFANGKTLIEKRSDTCDKKRAFMADYETMLGLAEKFSRQQEVKDEIKKLGQQKSECEHNKQAVVNEKEQLEGYLQKYVKDFFQVPLINQLYNTIDPHPEYKEVCFECEFTTKTPRLNVYMGPKDKGNDQIVPNLYFSTGQTNILSFCIFLAKALFAKIDDEHNVGCIFIDDPIQALDEINILSMIDLLRNVSFSLDRQIVLTTHDKNFFALLQKKIPQDKFNACYIELYERGKFRAVK